MHQIMRNETYKRKHDNRPFSNSNFIENRLIIRGKPNTTVIFFRRENLVWREEKEPTKFSIRVHFNEKNTQQ